MDQVTKQNKTAKKKLYQNWIRSQYASERDFMRGFESQKDSFLNLSLSLSLSFLIRFEIMKWKTKQKISDYRIYSILVVENKHVTFFWRGTILTWIGLKNKQTIIIM